MGLLDDTITPPASAYRAEPFSVAEIDAHPDSARLWATILAMRADYDAIVDDYEDRLRRAGDDA